MLTPSPNHGTLRLHKDDDDEDKLRLGLLPCVFFAVTIKHCNVGSSYKYVHMTIHSHAPNDYDKIYAKLIMG